MYNAVTIPFREAFDMYDTTEYTTMWLSCDSVADVIYLLDFFLVKPRIQYIEHGVVVVKLIKILNCTPIMTHLFNVFLFGIERLEKVREKLFSTV